MTGAGLTGGLTPLFIAFIHLNNLNANNIFDLNRDYRALNLSSLTAFAPFPECIAIIIVDRGGEGGDGIGGGTGVTHIQLYTATKRCQCQSSFTISRRAFKFFITRH